MGAEWKEGMKLLCLLGIHAKRYGNMGRWFWWECRRCAVVKTWRSLLLIVLVASGCVEQRECVRYEERTTQIHLHRVGKVMTCVEWR